MPAAMLTGASGGIGSALAGELAASGYEVTVVGRDQGSRARPGDAGVTTVTADLADPGQLRLAVTCPARLDALIHCAGVSEVAAVAETPLATWQETLSVNVVAAAELTRLVLPALRRAQGHVVFVNASPWLRAVPRWPAFTGSKAALRELADALRQEEHDHGVRVTTVYPAGTATPRLARIRAAFGRPYDPRQCIQPGTLASMICWTLAAPPDAYAAELSVLPRPVRED